MTPSTRPEDRLRTLLDILEIPARERWEELDSDRNVYDYWYGLGLIDGAARDALLSGSGGLEPDPIMRRYFATVDAVWPPGRYRGEPVIDLGSGYGHLTLWLALAGASRVHTIGDPERIGFIERLVRAAVARGLLPEGRIANHPGFVRVGATSLAPTIEPASVALVLMNDTLEHIHPDVIPWLLGACHADLRPGGLLISRQHNTSSPKTLARARELWDRFDRERLLPRRSEILRALAPEFAEVTVERLARATRGLVATEVEEVLGAYRRGEALPEPGPDTVAVNPDTGEPVEGRTDVPAVLSALRHAGFRARVYPEMANSRRSRWLQRIARRFPRPFLALHVFDGVTVFEAVKPGDADGGGESGPGPA